MSYPEMTKPTALQLAGSKSELRRQSLRDLTVAHVRTKQRLRNTTGALKTAKALNDRLIGWILGRHLEEFHLIRDPEVLAILQRQQRIEKLKAEHQIKQQGEIA